MRRARVVLFGDRIALFSIVAHELKEALVATILDTGDLEVVPGVVEERLHVALVGREALLVRLCAARADKGTEGHDAVRAPVVLAVDAEGVELLLVDAAAQVSRHIGTLNITTHARVGQRRVVHLRYCCSCTGSCRLVMRLGSSDWLRLGAGRRVVGYLHDDLSLTIKRRIINLLLNPFPKSGS